MFHVKHCGTFLFKTNILHSQTNTLLSYLIFEKDLIPVTENENVKTNSSFQNDTFYR